MRIALASAVLLLPSACKQSSTIEINTGEWTCGREADVHRYRPVPIGKTTVLLPRVQRECLQWTRFGVRP